MKNRTILFISLLLYLLISCSTIPIQEAYADPTPVTVTNPITINPPAAPIAPAGVVVSGITDSSATISWSPVVTASGYSVWVDGSRWTGADSPGIEIKGLQPDTLYNVYITASNDGGESGPSSSVSFTTLPPVPTAPPIPTVSNVTGNSSLLQWEPLPPWQNIISYRVYVDGTAIADIAPQTGMQSANLTNLPAGNHSITISGINANREGPESSPVQLITQVLPVITGFNMTNHSSDTIWLSWDAVTNATKYLISSNGQAAGVTSQANFTLTGLQPSQNYQLTLTVVMPDGNQSQAATLQAGTLPTASTYTKDTLMQAIFAYAPDMMPGLIAVFVVGVAFALARISKISIGSRGFRYWR